MEWINFRHLYSFFKVVTTGGFNAAANEINVSQSTVSGQVAELEDYLQKTLIERGHRKIILTSEGKKLFKYAQKVFELSTEINKALKDNEDESENLTRIGIVGGISRNLVYRLFDRALQDFDISQMEVTCGSFYELKSLSKKFDLDFFISTEPPFGGELISFSSHVIEVSPLVIAAKKKVMNKLMKDGHKKVDIYLFRHGQISDQVLKELEEKFDVNFNIKVSTDDISLLRFFANSGHGVSLVPEIGVKEDLSDGRIVAKRLTEIDPIQFFAVYPKVSTKQKVINQILQLSKYAHGF